MARKKKLEDSTRHEDLIIALSTVHIRFENPQLSNVVRHRLAASVHGGNVEKFLSELPMICGFYYGLAMDQPKRETLRRAAGRLSRLADELGKAILDLGPLAHSACLRARYPTVEEARKAQEDFGWATLSHRLAMYSGIMARAEAELSGTSQDGSRPIRTFIGMLYASWSRCAFPRPVWRGTADPDDPDAPDEDLFCEITRLIFDNWVYDRKDPNGPLGGRPKRSTISYTLKSVITERTKEIPLAARNSRTR